MVRMIWRVGTTAVKTGTGAVCRLPGIGVVLAAVNAAAVGPIPVRMPGALDRSVMVENGVTTSGLRMSVGATLDAFQIATGMKMVLPRTGETLDAENDPNGTVTNTEVARDPEVAVNLAAGVASDCPEPETNDGAFEENVASAATMGTTVKSEGATTENVSSPAF
jgi:hypothetical protein